MISVIKRDCITIYIGTKICPFFNDIFVRIEINLNIDLGFLLGKKIAS